MSKSGKYRELSAPEKRAEALKRIREPGVVCPVCEAKCDAADLVAHVEQRCTGPREPHEHARWITTAEALELGASRRTLYRWAEANRLRTRLVRGERQYLLRDVARRLAELRADCATDDTPTKRRTKRRTNLPRRRRRDRKQGMSAPLESTVIEQLQAYAQELGGFAACGRRMDIPEKTLRRAAGGESLRRGTRALIEGALQRAIEETSS